MTLREEENQKIIHQISEANDDVKRYINGMEAQLKTRETMSAALAKRIDEQSRELAANQTLIASLKGTIGELQQAMEKMNIQAVGA